jgi:hypothetical protein
MRFCNTVVSFASWQEIADVASARKAPCFAHGTLCDIPAPEEKLYINGFSCCQNSRQHPGRFSVDIVENPDAKHSVSCDAAIEHIKVRRPEFAVLENSTGLALCPQLLALITTLRNSSHVFCRVSEPA